MGQAFRLLLEEWLGRFGLLFVDPLAPEIRALGAPLLRQAMEREAEVEHRAAGAEQGSRIERISRAGPIEPKTSLFFLLENGRRVHLKRVNGGFSPEGRKYTAAEVAAHASRSGEPERAATPGAAGLHSADIPTWADRRRSRISRNRRCCTSGCWEACRICCTGADSR